MNRLNNKYLKNLKNKLNDTKIKLIIKQIKAVQKKSKNKFVIYSYLTNNYDFIIKQKIKLKDVDFIFLSDNYLKSHFWNIIKIDFIYRDPRRTAKIFKILPHIFFSSYEYSLCIDSNILLKNKIFSLIKSFKKSKNLLTMFEHSNRNCIYKEAKECQFWGLDDPKVIENQVKRYKKLKYPKNNGLMQCRFILRKHNNRSIKSLMEFWWSEIDKYSVRDQISFNFVTWKKKIDYEKIANFKIDKYIQVMSHRSYNYYRKKISLILNLKYLIQKIYFIFKKLT
ncbi:MAG: hypothetical protein CBC16_01700 [Verrucomicrobia bacterium TMED56]|nr:MAG: hypothetical protein CBC16_01700 [Verrucomicrobia bacterium TMED56]